MAEIDRLVASAAADSETVYTTVRGRLWSRNDAQAVAIRMRLVVPARPNGIPAMTTMV
jgi:hypothetical protein